MNDFDKLLRDAFRPELPYGFAERAASAAMDPAAGSLWEILLSLTPRAGVAIGAVATVLVLFGFAGSGPGLVESIDKYAQIGSILTLP